MSAPVTADRRTLKRRAVVASTVGTTIEWYDFFLHNTAAALVFGPLFFSDPATGGVLAAFSTQPVRFAARPIGAAIFGHYGDRLGRKYSSLDPSSRRCCSWATSRCSSARCRPTRRPGSGR